ncbi:insulin-like growth factor-binding protein 3 isoform X1 [Gadus chalcogrammus]|uniref:insulin-like growth factor-binding protein 3 isoform X1 n=1 Tax=Gadus chalcogrammus TaxID=1042646 RepID=UPI0024C4C1AA|nr:insulin-like growth factor-binding protein 3 isoform X1 [Gadus chalcogrammus]
MDACLRSLLFCASFIFAAFSRGSGAAAVGPLIRCEPCDVAARLLCKPLPKDCSERLREPGCGCCMTCALSFGQPCGFYTGRCGAGLACQHQTGETKPLHALIEGRGVCANVTDKRVSTGAIPPPNEIPAQNVENSEVEPNFTGAGVPSSPSPPRPAGPPSLKPLHPFFYSAKAEVLKRGQGKRGQGFGLEGVQGPLGRDQQNLSGEIRQESEYGPCRKEMENVLTSLKTADILNPRGFRIPNCDKKGFYKKKQPGGSRGTSEQRAEVDNPGQQRAVIAETSRRPEKRRTSSEPEDHSRRTHTEEGGGANRERGRVNDTGH